MTTALVFCTAILPTTLINQFLSISYKSNLDSGTSWSLVKDSNQYSPELLQDIESVTDFTKQSVSSSHTFETAFNDFTVEQLDQIQQGMGPIAADKLKFLVTNIYAVLDARSSQDQTVEMRSLLSTWPEEYIETANPDPKAEIRNWYSWRVKFEDAGLALVGLEYSDDVFLDNKDNPNAYDEKGAFKVREQLYPPPHSPSTSTPPHSPSTSTPAGLLVITTPQEVSAAGSTIIIDNEVRRTPKDFHQNYWDSLHSWEPLFGEANILSLKVRAKSSGEIGRQIGLIVNVIRDTTIDRFENGVTLSESGSESPPYFIGDPLAKWFDAKCSTQLQSDSDNILSLHFDKWKSVWKYVLSPDGTQRENFLSSSFDAEYLVTLCALSEDGQSVLKLYKQWTLTNSYYLLTDSQNPPNVVLSNLKAEWHVTSGKDVELQRLLELRQTFDARHQNWRLP